MYFAVASSMQDICKVFTYFCRKTDAFWEIEWYAKDSRKWAARGTLASLVCLITRILTLWLKVQWQDQPSTISSFLATELRTCWPQKVSGTLFKREWRHQGPGTAELYLSHSRIWEEKQHFVALFLSLVPHTVSRLLMPLLLLQG